MSSENSFFKINLISNTIKVIIGVFCIFCILLGFTSSFIFFSQDLLFFLGISTEILIFSIFLTFLLYIITHFPDETSPRHIRTYFFLILAGLVVISLIIWFSYLQRNVFYILLLFFQTIIQLFGLTIGLLIFPKNYVAFNEQTMELSYIKDFRTKTKRQNINLQNVQEIILGTKDGKGLGGGFARIQFILRQSDRSNQDNIRWNIRTFASAITTYELLRIFANFPLTVTINSKVLLRPIRDIIHKPISPTTANFYYSDEDRLKGIFYNCSNKFSITIPNTNIEILQRKKFINLRESTNSIHNNEKLGKSIRSFNRPVSILVLFISLFLLLFLGFYFIALNDYFLKTNLIQVLGKKTPEPRLDQMIEFTGLLVVLTILVPYLLLISWFGRDSFYFGNELLVYSVKIFNKNIFIKKIPIKAVINIECSEKQIKMRLLGGDSIIYWEGEPGEIDSKLRQLALDLS